MKLLTIATVATTLVASPTTTDIQKIDVSSMTCEQFTQTDPARMVLIMTWFMGFYAEVQNPQVIDLTKLEMQRANFVAFCKQEPTFHLTTAAEGLLGK
ncbi:MAG TPA: HdeA/HdeB family chaperone [Xanthobacteraceae bacterium]|nr:HdeA/HdeB family chaperone [Xanthobacteraceae bacterium]